MRSAYEGLGRLGIGADAGQAAAYLARALLQQGRIDEAERLAAESAELAGENPQTAIAARAAQAEILAAQGRYGEGVAVAREAVARAEGTDIIVDHAAASAVLAHVAELAGDVATAERAARAAADLYDQKAATVATEVPGPAAIGDIPLGAAAAPRDDVPLNRADRWGRQVFEAVAARRIDDVRSMLEEDCEVHEREPGLRAVHVGRDEVLAALSPGLFPEGATVRADVETIAVRGDDLVLHRVVIHVAGETDGASLEALHVSRWNERGRSDFAASYRVEDLDDAVAELDRLHRTTGGNDHEPWNEADRLARRFVESFTAGAREEWLPLLSPDQETIDRRPLVGVDTTGADGVAAAYPRDRQTRAMASEVETIAVRGESFALVRWKAASAHGREWDGFHLTRWTADGLNDLNVIFPADQLDEALTELDRLYLGEDREPTADEPVHELPGRTRPIEHEPWNEADRLARRLIELFFDRSSEAWSEMLDPAHVSIDRQPIVAHRLEGRDATIEIWTRENMDDDATSVAETIATRGERLALHLWAVAMGSGRWATDALNVTRWNERGLVDLNIRFDVDQLGEAVEELERLYQAELGDSTEALQVREFERGMRLLSEGDLDAYVGLHDPSFVMRDHRQLGRVEQTLEEYRPRMAAIADAAGHAPVFRERLLRIDHTSSMCAAHRLVVTTPDGSQQLARSVMVMIIDPHTHLITLIEQFDVDQVDEAVARFDELMVERGPVLHNEASVRASFVNAWLRRGDHDVVAEAIVDDLNVVDDEGHSSGLSAVERREVIAVRGDRLALVQASGPGHAFVVEEVDEDGKLSSIRRFGSDRLRDAMVALDRRWLEIGGDDIPLVVRVVTEYTMCSIEGDLDRLSTLLHEDHELVDHRAFGWPRLERDDVLAMVARGEDEGVLVVAERLDADGDACLARVASWETDPDRASTQGFVAFTVAHIVDGSIRTNEFFEDVEIARAHLEALGHRARSDVAVLDERHRLERVEGGDFELTVVDDAGQGHRDGEVSGGGGSRGPPRRDRSVGSAASAKRGSAWVSWRLRSARTGGAEHPCVRRSPRPRTSSSSTVGHSGWVPRTGPPSRRRCAAAKPTGRPGHPCRAG